MKRGPVHLKLEEAMIIHYGLSCWLCGNEIDERLRGSQKRGAFTRDHVVPLGMGGENKFWNLRPAHMSCNSQRTKKFPHTVKKSFLKRFIKANHG